MHSSIETLVIEICAIVVMMYALFLLLLSTVSPAASQFAPCPLLGPAYPKVRNLANNDVIKSALEDLTSLFDEAVKTGNTSFGPITPDTTSFSIALFDSSSDGSDPFFFDYHYTAPSLANSTIGTQSVNADSVYRAASLTQVFSVWSFLINAGPQLWHDPVTKYVPELADAMQSELLDPILYVNWDEVTLGDLAGHMSGIGRNCKNCSAIVDRADFFENFLRYPPVALPSITPVYSDAAFQILGYALQSIAGGKSFEQILSDHIFAPLGMANTFLTTPDITSAVIPGDEIASGWDLQVGDLSPSIGLYSTISDLSLAGRNILSSSLIPQSATRQWLKPLSLTSNPANSISRPWTIFSAPGVPTETTITEVYTALGSIGHYSAYLGLVPNYDVGFAILSADSLSAPDLNAYADLIAVAMLPALEEAAKTQAGGVLAGTFASPADAARRAVVELGIDDLPGLPVAEYTVNGVDMLEALAEKSGIAPDALSVRLYPTIQVPVEGGGQRVAFRAVIQDMDELADAGTPTCVSWMGLDKFSEGGMPLDEFVVEVGADGRVEMDVVAWRSAGKLRKE